MIESKLPDVGTTIFTTMSALAAKHDAINLSQGYPDFDGPEALREALGRHAMAGHNQYAPMAGLPALRTQISAQVARFRDVHVDADTEVTVVPGATEAIYCAIAAAIHPGDEVILLDPSYDSYAPSIVLAGGVAVRVALNEDDFSVDWDAVRRAATTRTRMIVVNSPHNPTGSVLSRRDLDELARLASEHDLLVISDEVYEHLVFDGHQHHSVLQHPDLRERSFAVYSFGKTYSITGWKTGYCIAAPTLTAELRKVHQFVTFVAVTPIQHALADFLAAEPDYPATLAAQYQARRDSFLDALAGGPFTFTPSAGTYFQLLDYRRLSDAPDTELAERWTRERGVASIPISVFSAAQTPPRFLRFCFAKQESTLIEAARRLIAPA